METLKDIYNEKKEWLNNDGQQLEKYHQSEQSPSPKVIEHKKDHDIWC